MLFLQQSSVEWCSSLWMHVIQEVDPNFQRTVSLSTMHLSVWVCPPTASQDFHQRACQLHGRNASHACLCQGRLLQLHLVEVPCRRLFGVLPAELQLCGTASVHTIASRRLKMAEPADSCNFADGPENVCMWAGDLQCAESP